MWMAIVRNESTGEFECQYKTQVLGSLHLSQPNTLALPEGDQETTKLWTEHETHSELAYYAQTHQVMS